MVDKVELHGLKELRAKLKKLPLKIQQRELNRALRRGGAPMLALARQLAPVGTSFVRRLRGKEWKHTGGLLANSIVMRSERKKFLRNTAKQRIGVVQTRNKGDTAFYWRHVEFGTSKQRAQPFLIPSFELLKVHSSNIIRRELLKGVERQARRL